MVAEVKLLPNATALEEFKLLRLITVLASSAKWFSRVLVLVSEKLGVGVAGTGHPERAMLGCRKGHQCPGNPAGNSMGWGSPRTPHNSTEMYRRGVPMPTAMAHL